MTISIPAIVLGTVLALQEEGRLLATIPAELALEGKPIVSPDGLTTVRDRVRFVWSSDGSAVGYVGLRGEHPVPVFGEKQFGGYAWADGAVFSADSKHWAVRVGKSAGKDRERWWVLLDGKEVGAEDWIGAVSLAPTGGGWCAWTQPGARYDASGAYARGDQVLVTPWKKGVPWSDASSLLPPRFAPDGAFVTTLASKAGTWRLLIADKKGERELGQPWSWILAWDVAADGKSFALAVADSTRSGPSTPPVGMLAGGMKSVIVFGKDKFGAEHERATAPLLAPDGKHVAWRFRAKGKAGVAVDAGKDARATHDGITAIAWRPDGKELAFVACDGGHEKPGLMTEAGEPILEGGTWTVVRRASNGKETPEGAAWSEIADLAWSKDGKVLGYAAKNAEGWRIVCGAQQGAAFDEVGPPRIAADGKSVGYGARKDRELHWKVLPLE
ncbi:MAG: hypothetical protein HZA53_05705 [Planctomycetes bacterium]|nr:hypothetical protein [Planctomycetota bacterium]